MQRLGQHFIQDAAALKKMARSLALADGETVIEIGPGHGELTGELTKAADGIQIIAIEKDKTLADVLVMDGVQVVNADVLEALAPEAARHTSYKLAGNIPYYITGYLLRTIGELKNKPSLAVLMMQKEVAERIVAEPPKMNRLAASVQFWAEPSIVGIVKKESFMPRPLVDSAILLLQTKNGVPPAIESQYYRALHAIFAQPRKTLANNLAAALKDKEKCIAAMEECGLDPKCRPQNLTIAQIAVLAKSLF